MKKWKRFTAAMATVVSLTTLTLPTMSAAAAAPKQVSAANFKVGLVTDVGGLNDHSFNHLAYMGVLNAQKKYHITYSVVQSHQESDYVPNLSAFAQKGYNLVIAVGFLMDQAVQQVSKQYPNTKFLIIDDAITNRKNVMSAIFDTQQCGYLVGVMAGLMSLQKHNPMINGKNVVGMVGGMDIPPVESYMAGYLAGVKKVDPKATVLIDFANSFTDPGLGKEDTLAQISKGADIVFQVAGSTGLGVIEAAKEKNVYAIGVDADQGYLAPNNVLTSALKGVDVATESAIADALHNKFKSGIVHFNLANGGVGFAPPAKSVPASVIKEVNSFIPLLKSGKINPPVTLPKQG